MWIILSVIQAESVWLRFKDQSPSSYITGLIWGRSFSSILVKIFYKCFWELLWLRWWNWSREEGRKLNLKNFNFTTSTQIPWKQMGTRKHRKTRKEITGNFRQNVHWSHYYSPRQGGRGGSGFSIPLTLSFIFTQTLFSVLERIILHKRTMRNNWCLNSLLSGVQKQNSTE